MPIEKGKKKQERKKEKNTDRTQIKLNATLCIKLKYNPIINNPK